MTHTLQLLVERLATIALEWPDGIEDAETEIDEVGATGTMDSLPALAPLIAARAWPLPTFLNRAALSAKNARLGDAASRAGGAILARHPIAALVWLDQQLRGHGWLSWVYASARVFEYHAKWRDVAPTSVDRVCEMASPADRVVLLGMLSSHPNGRVRERALEHLARGGAACLPWIALRTIDWVVPIRTRAAQALAPWIEPHHVTALCEVLPLVRRLRGFLRGGTGSAIDRVVDFVARQPEEILEPGLAHPVVYVRRAVLQSLDANTALSPAAVVRAIHDRDVLVRTIGARFVGNLRPAEAATARQLLLRDRLGRLRARGLELELDAAPDASKRLLRDALLDDAGSVRGLAQRLLRLREPATDVAECYRHALRDAFVPVGAVIGLGETGRPGDWELLVPCLDARPAVARAAIGALRRLDRAETRELRLVMVDDARPGVCRDAVASLRGEILSTDESTLRAYLASPRAHVRARTTYLLAELAGWTGVRILLGVKDPLLEKHVDAALGDWLARRWHTVSAPLASESHALHELLRTAPLLSDPLRARFVTLLTLAERTAR